VLLLGDTYRTRITSITAVLLPFVTYLLTLPRIYEGTVIVKKILFENLEDLQVLFPLIRKCALVCRLYVRIYVYMSMSQCRYVCMNISLPSAGEVGRIFSYSGLKRFPS
jgi:hypothetical protein